MSTVSPSFVKEVIDFAPTKMARGFGFAELQVEGTAALFNMLERNRCAYLADEVGTGKTYVALGVMALTRYFNPHARIVVIAPRENIQLKWIKELKNFVRLNWQLTGNRVKSLQGEPAWAPVYCNSLVDFAAEALLDADRDFFLRMTSFSLAVKNPDRRQLLRQKLCERVSWLPSGTLSATTPEALPRCLRLRDQCSHATGRSVSDRRKPQPQARFWRERQQSKPGDGLCLWPSRRSDEWVFLVPPQSRACAAPLGNTVRG